MTQQEADALVAKGLEHPAVKALYDEVNASSPIMIVPDEGHCWASITRPAGTEISVAGTAFPAESLYHELLHAQMKIGGYRQYNQYLQVAESLPLNVLGDALDNELQHHRFFSTFTLAGFDPAHFYHDGDNESYEHIRRLIESSDPAATSSATYFLRYLTVLSPGGHGSDAEREALKQFFFEKVPKEKMDAVEAAAAEVLAFGGSDRLDPGDTIQNVAQLLGGFHGWWVGKSQVFPDEGVFTGDAFTMDDAQEFAARQGR
ncbi:MAG: hypothetical protein ABIQ66_10685 [Novosphingobium sp.]